MRKGFTLVELLAVIVILAIVLAIAIPSISKIMDSVKTNALINNTQMMLKATKNYIALEQIALPKEIGATTEIKLSDLQSKNYIGDIVSPSDKNKKCNGYIIITKIDNTNYDYSPYLNCINDIGSIADDNLLFHYKFDDFQEPTTNLITNPTLAGQTGLASAFSDYGAAYGITYSIVNDSYISGTFSQRLTYTSDTNNASLLNKGIKCNIGNPVVGETYSLTFYGKGFEEHGDIDLYSTGYALLSSSKTVVENGWTKYEYKYRFNGPNTDLYIRPNRNKEYSFDALINAPQWEQKDHATPFVSGSRLGIITDYSGLNNTTSLSDTTTPKWISKGIAGTGAYEFDGVNDYISIPYTAALAPTAQISFSLWLYKTDWSTVFGSGFSALSKTEGGGYNCNIDSDGGTKYIACLVRRNGTYGMVDYQYTSLSSGWHNFVTTYDGRYLKLYIDGLLQKTNDAGATYPIQYSVNNNLIIGGEASGGSTAANYFKGSIDDVQIYSRALTEAEINQMYQLGLRGY